MNEQTQTIDPGEGWRLLAEKETLREGDQFLNGADEWQQIMWERRVSNQQTPGYPYRRRIEQPVPTPDESGPSKRGAELLEYLNSQFPATVGHIPLRQMVAVIDAEHAAAFHCIKARSHTSEPCTLADRCRHEAQVHPTVARAKIPSTPAHGVGKQEMTFRMAANAIWNKLNIAMMLAGQMMGDGVQLDQLLGEARALADSVVAHPDSGEFPTVTGDDRRRQALFAEAGEALAQVEQLKDALHTDQTGLAAAMAIIHQTAGGYGWVAQGRGPYEWDDPEYRKEMGRMVNEIVKLAADALRESGDRAHVHCCNRKLSSTPSTKDA